MENSKVKKIIKITIVIAIFCVLCTAPLYLDNLNTSLLNFIAPHASHYDTHKPILLHEFSGRVYKIDWLDDVSHIRLSISNWTSSNPEALNTIADYNLETNDVRFQEDIAPSIQDFPPEIIQRLGIDPGNDYWTFCPENNRVIAAGGFEGDEYWLKYWENEILKYTFNFSSEQWLENDYAPFAYLDFSPSCSKATLILSGWIYWEGEGNRELWMLDISSGTFERLVIGKSPIFGMWDYPVQDVTPSWSPNEDKFVFGGWSFGLEVYDLSSSKRRILTGPHYNLHNAQWSPSGEWIAAIQIGAELDHIYIFSPDGALYSSTEGCNLRSDFQWAPVGNKIVFICYGDCNELCEDSCQSYCNNNCDNPCENLCPRSDYLWLWDLD